MPDSVPGSSTIKAPLPTPPVRQFSFTNVSTNTPTAQQPGDRMDAEYDRSNAATTELIDFVAVTFNTDGSLVPGSVGLAQLDPDIVADITADIEAQVQPLVDSAQGYAASADTSAQDAAASATQADNANTAAQGAAGNASSSAATAQQASTAAQGYATTASNAQAAAVNAANDTDEDVALAQDYALVTQAWAEHMPDTIPPNILAVMNITGDHWSSRWWANKAAGAFGELASLYMGALPHPPMTTPTGDPIPVGGIYYDTTTQQPYVWTGTQWQPFWAPTKALTLTLVYQATANQTVFNTTTRDLAGNNWTFSSPNPEPVEVFVSGDRLAGSENSYVGAWTLNPSANTVTFASPIPLNSLVIIDILTPAAQLAPSAVTTRQLLPFNINPSTGNPGQIDGVQTTFPLALSDRSALTVNTALELLICVDGVPQQPGIDFVPSGGGTSITFSEAPALGAVTWGLWFTGNAPATPGSGIYLPISGGAMTGMLTLQGPPTLPLGAATKAYVDAQFVGTYLPLAGGTLTGNLTVSNAAPTGLNTLLALNQPNLAAGQYTILRLGQDGNTNYKSGYIAWLANATQNLSRMVLGVRGYATGDILTMDGTGAVTFNAPTIQMINGELIPQRLNLGNANGNGLSQTVSGAFDHTTSPIWENYYFSGNNANVNNQNFNTIIVNDSVNYTGNGQSNALYISQVSGAAATRAGGLWVQTTQSAAPTSPWRASTAITGASSLSFNCGGTALTPTGVAGYATTLNTYTTAAAGATFLLGLVGYEMDIHALAGSSLAAKTGLFIVLLTDDAVSGAFGHDSAVAFAAGAGSAHGWDYLLNFGGGSTQIPFKPTATLIGCFEPQTPASGQALASWGIDLSGVLFSGGFARSLGFMVDGSGNTTGQAHNMSNWSFTPSSTGLAVDVAGQRSSLTSIAAGGSNWSAGDKVTTAYGGVYQITAVSGGVATAVTQLVPGISASPPANPVAATATNATAFHPGGSGLTLNLAWTQANTLALNPSGGPITTGGPLNYTATGGTVVRSAQARAAESVNVKDFGAVGDGTTDDTAAINAALNYVRANLIVNVGSSGPHTPFRLAFPQGRYLVTAPLNFTGLTSISGGVIDGMGSEIFATMSGGIVIDCTGSRWLRFEHLTIYGDPTNPPNIGMQLSVTQAGKSADYFSLICVNFWGNFGLTAFYNLNSENFNAYDCSFRNYATGTNKFCVVLDGLNHWAASSTFVAITAPVESRQSFEQCVFIGTAFQGWGTNGVIWHSNTSRHAFKRCYASNQGANSNIHTFYMPTAAAGGGPISAFIELDFHTETNAVTNMIVVTAAAGVTGAGIYQIELKEDSAFATAAIFAIDPASALTVVELRAAELDVWAANAKLFDQPAKWVLRGKRVDLYTTAMLPTLPLLLTGRVTFSNNPTSSFLALDQWTSTARPALAPIGAIGVATDTGRFEIYDGNAWRDHVRLDGDTMTGMLTANGGITFQGGTNVAGTIYTDSGWGCLIRGRSGTQADVALQSSSGTVAVKVNGLGVGFNGTAGIAKPTISGACAGNTAIKNLLTALASYGLVTDSTTA